jgi:hypothetical protein
MFTQKTNHLNCIVFLLGFSSMDPLHFPKEIEISIIKILK